MGAFLFAMTGRTCWNIFGVRPLDQHLFGVRIMDTLESFITTSLSVLAVSCFILISGIGLH